MKKTIEVIITKQIEVEINDASLTPEFIAQFEKGMFNLDDEENGADKIERLFSYAARQVAEYGEETFVEGLGQGAHWSSNEPFDLRCKETDCEFETEILD